MLTVGQQKLEGLFYVVESCVQKMMHSKLHFK
jgi:hypothetical protein